MKIKILMTILTAILVLTTAFMVSASTNVVVTEDFGVVYKQLAEETQEQEAELYELTQLPTPKDLRWNEDWSEYRSDNQPYYGFVSWNVVGNAEGEYTIELFCNGESIYYVGAICYDDDGNGRVGWDFPKDLCFSKSGKYTFEVTAKGDGKKYKDSNVAKSNEFNFVAPNRVLKTPEKARWDGNRITHTSVENASDYVYYVYDQKHELRFSIHGSGKYPLYNQPEITGFDMSVFIDSIIPNNYSDITKIYVSVIAITYDIRQYQNSKESGKSDAKVFAEHEEDMTSTLENAISGVENETISAKEALGNLIDFMEESGSTNVDLAITMMKDSDVEENIDLLEEKLIEQTGINVEVRSTAEDESYLSDRGIDVNNISVKGAALNSNDGANVSLNFSEADSGISADENYYKNSVAVNIGMDGVKNEQKLDIPVIIEMPVPTGVLPERLFIIHYHADGSYEHIYPNIIYKSGTPYARFILTSFSTFIFCNYEIELGKIYDCGNSQSKITINDLIMLAQYVAGNRELTPEQIVAANVCTEDDILGGVMSNNINENDLKMLAEYLVGNITQLG